MHPAQSESLAAVTVGKQSEVEDLDEARLAGRGAGSGAAIAAFEMSAERRRSTSADIAQYLALLVRKHMAPALKELVLVSVKDIGHFQPGVPGKRSWLAGVEADVLSCRSVPSLRRVWNADRQIVERARRAT